MPHHSTGHKHRCRDRRCSNGWTCYGSQEFNYDGMPETVCSYYHKDMNHDYCEKCEATRCDECGNVLRLDDGHDASCPWSLVP